MTIEEYKKFLVSLDPFFGFSDDHKYWKEGSNRWHRALNIAKEQKGLYMKAWEEYNDSIEWK